MKYYTYACGHTVLGKYPPSERITKCYSCYKKKLNAMNPEELREHRQEILDRRSEKYEERAKKKLEKAEKLDKELDPYKDWQFVTQPILVGHHSEKRHRNLKRKISNKMDKIQELRNEAKELMEKTGRKARVKGDAERARQKKREELDKVIVKGSKVVDFAFGLGVVTRVNKKTYTIQFESGGKYAREKTFVKPVFKKKEIVNDNQGNVVRTRIVKISVIV